MVVFAVVAGEVLRLEEDGDSVADGEALAGGGEEQFAAVLGDEMEGIAGEGAAEAGDGLGAVGPEGARGGMEGGPEG